MMGFFGRLKRPAGSIDHVDDGAKVKLPTLEGFRDAIIGSIIHCVQVDSTAAWWYCL
jgi:hypothetical protein